MQGEYKGDYARDTFDPLKHYSRVLRQQGRLDLEADGNEQTSIHLHYLQRLAADLIGPHGGPGDGFNILPLTGAGPLDFGINPGHYYVDGILCELALPPVPIQTVSGNQVFMNTPGTKGGGWRVGEHVRLLDADKQTVLFEATIQHFNPAAGNATLGQAVPKTIATPKYLQGVTSYNTQPDFPNPPPLPTTAPGAFLVYLDVWERHLTFVEDDTIREVALGGPDTSARAKIVWQVKVAIAPPALPANAADDKSWADWVERWQPENRGLLRARVQPQTSSLDPCTISPSSVYRGAENQLYRVEIHTGSPDGGGQPATFKWSRENGSVVFRILKLDTDEGRTTLTLTNLGRDEHLGLRKGDQVEIVDDESALQNRADQLLRVKDIDHTARTVTLDGVTGVTVEAGTNRHPLLRRWDQRVGDGSDEEARLAEDGAVPIQEGKRWYLLEDGIQVQFQLGGTYRTGDYWLIPARVATGDIEWPKVRHADGSPVLDNAHQPIGVALPPHGVEHRYAPLAVVAITASGTPPTVTSLRRVFAPLAK